MMYINSSTENVQCLHNRKNQSLMVFTHLSTSKPHKLRPNQTKHNQTKFALNNFNQSKHISN